MTLTLETKRVSRKKKKNIRTSQKKSWKRSRNKKLRKFSKFRIIFFCKGKYYYEKKVG